MVIFSFGLKSICLKIRKLAFFYKPNLYKIEMKKKKSKIKVQAASKPAPNGRESEDLGLLRQQRRDDLLNIAGIDPTTELALNSIGLRRFADFERYTPATLAKALQERTGLAVTAETIANEYWIGAAAIFAAVSDDTGKPTDSHELLEEAPQPAALPAEQFSAAPAEELAPAAVSGAPAPQENISTQNISNTTVSDGATEVNKNDSEILQTELNEEKGNGALWIQHVAFTPMETPAQPHRPATKFLRSEIVIGAEAKAVGAEGTLLCAQVHAVDTATGEDQLLAAQAERLQRSQTDYPVQLEFAVPGIGRYQLHII